MQKEHITVEFDENIDNILNKPLLRMYAASFLQGLEEAAKDLLLIRIKKLEKPTTYNIDWVFNSHKDQRILSFNWYCSLFNQDPEKVRKSTLNMSYNQEFKSITIKRYEGSKHKDIYTREYCLKILKNVPEVFVKQDLLLINGVKYISSKFILSLIKFKFIEPTGIKFKNVIQYRKTHHE